MEPGYTIEALRISVIFRVKAFINNVLDIINDGFLVGHCSEQTMITAAQMRAARALLGIDQRQLAESSGVSLPTIRRMEASEGNVRGVVDTPTKIIEAFDRAGVELIGENVRSIGVGCGVRHRLFVGASAGFNRSRDNQRFCRQSPPPRRCCLSRRSPARDPAHAADAWRAERARKV